MTFRYRRLDENLDMTFGHGAADFLVDSSAAVAQSVLTRLCLWEGEWWLDLTEGTPWLQQILGKPIGPGSPDSALRSRIAGTPYLTRINDYASVYNSTNRSFRVGCKVDTAFGPARVSTPPLFIPTPVTARRRLPPPNGR